MVHQLFGSQTKAKVKQLLVSRFQLLHHFFSTESSNFCDFQTELLLLHFHD